jgi:REP-associated tyrosine transposase
LPRACNSLRGRTAQAYHQRKGRQGAYWDDCYHATAIQTGEALARGLAYIDLNMVRAGVVTHPREWKESGDVELHAPPRRYRIVNLPVLMGLVGVDDVQQLQEARAQWVDQMTTPYDDCWTESLAVGSQEFVEGVKAMQRGK